MFTVLDVENSGRYRTYGSERWLDISPYHPDNRLVSYGVRTLQKGTVPEVWSDVGYRCVHSNLHPSDTDAKEYLAARMAECTLLIGHHIKHDLSWIFECGFQYSGDLWDTALAEYILLRGLKAPLSLKEVANRLGVSQKKSDLVKGYLDREVSFEDIPWEIVEEYGIADVVATSEIFEKQWERFHGADKHLYPTFRMSCAYVHFLVELERNGIAISEENLREVEQQYILRHEELKKGLEVVATKYMGGVPIELSSPDFRSKLFFSRVVNDKTRWHDIFNIGVDYRGKANKPPTMTKALFNGAVRALTSVVFRQDATQCRTCSGSGRVDKAKKDGTPYINKPRCLACDGTGVIYSSTGKVAGFKLVPRGPADCANAGFKTNKETLEELLEYTTNLECRQFIKDWIEYNAISTYLNTFVNAILRFSFRSDSIILHTVYNQTVTSTGRLSSSNPNLQNMPRGKTFPVRRAFQSRFPGGTLTEADYSGLEFRAAGALSGCPIVLRDILDAAFDPHAFTRDTINAYDISLPQIDRQDSKPHCFPLSTRVLTPFGWKSYSEIKVGDKVINYNPATKQLEVDTVIDYTAPHKQPVVRMKTKHNWAVDSTPEHRWYCDKRTDHGKYRSYDPCVALTKDINSEHRIITSAAWNNTVDTNVDDAARIGWLWSDGHVSKSNVNVIQKKYKDVVEALFNDLITSYSELNGCRKYNISLPSARKLLTKYNADKSRASDYILSLSHDARLSWLKAVQLAEGTQRKNGEWRIAQNSGPMAEAIKLCGFLCGFDIRVTKVIMKYNGNSHEQITLCTRPYVTGQRIIKEDMGEQDVWCVTTNNRTVVIKQDETISISGNTFKPLYGGTSGSPREKTYYRAFLDKYTGIRDYHDRLKDAAVRTRRLRLPTGREYDFPSARRLPGGYVFQTTQIVNWPVQGYATADIAPVGFIATLRLFRARGFKSILCMTTHDSLVADTYPGEEDAVQECMMLGMLSVPEMFQEFYGIPFTFPLGVEIKRGVNGLDMKELGKFERHGNEYFIVKDKKRTPMVI